MNKRVFVWSLAALAVALALSITAGTALAGGWNHNYTDASNDTTYANVDITRVKSYAQGTDIILQLTVRGVIEDADTTTYFIWVGSQTSGYGLVYINGTGGVVGPGGVNLNVIKTSSNTLQGSMPQAGLTESAFDVIGSATYVSGSTVYSDYAGAAHGGDGTTDAGLILGMAFGLFLLVLLVPIIILIVVILVIVLVLKNKKAPVPPPVQQPPYPQQQYPQQQYPQYPPQQYPPPPQQYPPRGPPPQEPGQ